SQGLIMANSASVPFQPSMRWPSGINRSVDLPCAKSFTCVHLNVGCSPDSPPEKVSQFSAYFLCDELRRSPQSLTKVGVPARREACCRHRQIDRAVEFGFTAYRGGNSCDP